MGVASHSLRRKVAGSRLRASACEPHHRGPALELRTGEQLAPLWSPTIAVAGSVDEHHASSNVKEVEHRRVALA